MKNVFINDDSYDESKIEKTEDGKYILEGIFTEFDQKSHPGRIYDEKDFLPHLEELKNRKIKNDKII